MDDDIEYTALRSTFGAPLVLADLSPAVRTAILAEITPTITISGDIESAEYEDGRLKRYTIVMD